MNYLGRPLSSSLDINPDGWVIAHRLIFNHDVNSTQINASLKRYHYLRATTTPLTVKVDHDSLVGQGSMRKAFSAQVKTEGRNGGPPRITNWVAKVRYHDEYPDIKLHATDARMYEAAGHLLQAYQAVIKRCSSNLISGLLREKAKAFKVNGFTSYLMAQF
jgi:hypothetical protein